MASNASGPLRRLTDQLVRGEISRRTFLNRSLALGISAATAGFIANTLHGAAQESTSEPAAGSRPASGTENQERGAGGELKLLQWQPPTTLGAHVNTGTKDTLAASLVLEPLLHVGPDGRLLANLVQEVPTQENGLLAQDLTGVTFNLLPGVLWSDGVPFTSADVKFTWEWISNPDNASTSFQRWDPIASIETPDDLTVVVSFKTPQLLWYGPFAGGGGALLYPKHVLEAGEGAHDAFKSNPIGTGPYKVDAFFENDQVIYSINENYREPNKPFFASVNLKGGGDAASAARAVLQTGEYDYAWFLNVEPEILRDLEQGGAGQLVIAPSANIEFIQYNFSDPTVEVDGERSHKDVPHRFWSEFEVRRAFALTVDRELIGSQLFFGGEGSAERATPNLINGAPDYWSPNNEIEFDIEQANAILDEAGWVLNGSVREKDGIPLSLTYATSVNTLRQKIQAIVKQGAEEAGFQVDLVSIDAGIFFDSAPGNEQNILHFYWDLQQFQTFSSSPLPIDLLRFFYAGPDGSNIPQKANSWSGQNRGRYVSEEYDALYAELLSTTDPERAAELVIALNDNAVQNYAVLPLVNPGTRAAYATRLNAENIAIGPFEVDYWNIANWNLADGS